MIASVEIRGLSGRNDYLSVYDITRVIGNNSIYFDYIQCSADYRVVEDKMYIHIDGLLQIANMSEGRGANVLPAKLRRLYKLITETQTSTGNIKIYSQVKYLQNNISRLTLNQRKLLVNKNGIFAKHILSAMENRLIDDVADLAPEYIDRFYIAVKNSVERLSL